MWKQKPDYPVITTSYCNGTIEHVLALKNHCPAGVFRRVGGLDDDLNDILEALQALTSMAEGSWRTEEHERNLMRGIYIVEHMLLGMLEDASPSRTVVVLAFGLYLYLGLREMSRTATILGRVAKRLRVSWTQAGSEGLEANLLFWISCLGTVAATRMEERAFFQGIEIEAGTTLGIKNADGRGEVLMNVVWTKQLMKDLKARDVSEGS
jgi:hypothetical protein